ARAEMGSSSRSQIFSVSSDKGSSNDNNSDSSYIPDRHNGMGRNQSVTGEGLSVARYEDDIVKSVHLNQDGSITVEMQVRLKIKEEETIKWTTTVSRAGLSGEQNGVACSAAVRAEHRLPAGSGPQCTEPAEAPLLESYSKEEGDSLKQFNEEGSDKESNLKTVDGNDCKSSSADLDGSHDAEDRPRFYRPPTPGPRRVRQKKAVVESVTLVSEKEVQEKTIGQFSYSEEVDNGENKSEYCMVAHSSRKTSSVINPKFSEMGDSDLLKLSSENIKEEMLFKVSHRSSDLIETRNRKTLEVPDEDELVPNILEKSVVEQGTYNSLVSTYKASSKAYQAARPVSADHIQESLHSACSGHEHSCSKTPAEKINPTTGLIPTVTESENQVSVESESVRPPHLTDDSQSASSVTKKKKKRKSSNFIEQGPNEIQKDRDISGIIISEGMCITSKSTQDPTTEATDNSSEMPQKKGTEYFVKNKESVNLEKSVCPEDEFCHQDSGEQNGLLSNKKTRSNNKKLAKVKLKSGKKNSIVSSSKSHDGVMTVDSNSESQHSLDTVGTVKEGSHPTTDSYEQTLNSSVVSKPLSEVPKNLNFEEKESNNFENLSSKKQKKQKGMKKNLSKGASKLNVSESTITLEALKQEDFQPVVEHSLENYVQSWLKNVLPNSVLPPIKKREGNVENSNFPEEKSDISAEKEIRFITNEVHVAEEKHLIEQNLTKKTLKPICELGTLEESAKNSGENQTDSLIPSNTTVVEAAKCSQKSEFHHDGELHVFHETHDKDKQTTEADVQDTNLCQGKKSEVAVQVDCTIVSEKLGLDLQNNCVSSTLLHELQSALLSLQKEHSGCIGKACSFSELCPSTFGSSSNVILAWLLVLNLRESLTGTIKDDMQKATCNCSEIFTQLQLLKQTTVAEKADELKAALSHFQQPTENSLLHMERELKTQDSTQCHEDILVSETHTDVPLHENENSVEPSSIAEDNV
ncbi:RP1 protein, partial [Alcedo cyanopectus]|nr:RP1 protein [Ceyx cyanopectus]